MTKLISFCCFIAFFLHHEQLTTKQSGCADDSTIAKRAQVSDIPAGLFADKYFTFLHLDSLNEEMLRDTTIKRDHKYIRSVKKFMKDHCKFFKTGCRGYFVDDHVFLVSKQNSIGNFLPVIIHDSRDFNYYHSELYVLDKSFNKVDSLTVSISGSGIQSDEPSIYYKTKVSSKFDKNKIITTEIEYWRYSDNDSTVIVDKSIIYREIGRDGKITILRKQKLI